MSTKQPWSPEAHEALAIAFADTFWHEMSQERKDDVVDKVNSMGYGFTWQAIRYVSIFMWYFESLLSLSGRHTTLRSGQTPHVDIKLLLSHQPTKLRPWTRLYMRVGEAFAFSSMAFYEWLVLFQTH